MSRRAILTAVRDQLKAPVASGGLALMQKECELCPLEGRPPPRCGERFVGVWAGPRGTRRTTGGILESYDVNVTVTMRIPRVPYDSLGPQLLEKATTGFDDLVDAVRLCITKDITNNVVLQRANATIGFTGDNSSPLGFFGACEFQGDGGNVFVAGEWFKADPEAEEVGVVCNLRFAGMWRGQSFEDVRALS